jgi:regulator of protease activity HflC (stomatin/prohibitin superfamily)
MKKLLSALVLVSALALTTGCGHRTMIENGEVGKQLTTSGLEDKVRAPGAFRMESCILSSCPKLVRLSVAENNKVIPGNYFIAKSDLELGIDLSLQYGLKRDNASLNEVFSRIRGVPLNSSELVIAEDRVFEVFVQPVIRDTVRTALNQYSIEQIMENLPLVREYVESEVRKKLNNSPIDVISLSFSKVSWPTVILQAKEEFAKIEISKATEMRAVAADLEILASKMELEKERARMALEVDSIIASKMTPELAQFMLLNAINKSAENSTPWAVTDSTVLRGR